MIPISLTFPCLREHPSETYELQCIKISPCLPRLDDDPLPLWPALCDPRPHLLLVHVLALPEFSRLLPLDLTLDKLERSQVVPDRLALPAKSGFEVGAEGDDGRSHEVGGDDLGVVGAEEEEEDAGEEGGVPFLGDERKG